MLGCQLEQVNCVRASDCSGTNMLIVPGLPFPVVIDIVMVHHGKEFHGVVASRQLVMVPSTGRRVD